VDRLIRVIEPSSGVARFIKITDKHLQTI